MAPDYSHRMAGLPEDVAAVVGPLREADDYGRLQLQRQKGVYNLLTGAPGFLFVFLFWNPFGSAAPFAFLATLGLFVVASFGPRWLLPLVRRRRPDWEASFLDADPLNRAMEKLYWTQAAFFGAAFVLLPMLLVGFAFLAFGDAALMASTYRMILGARLAVLVLHVGAMATLAWQAQRTGDALLARLFLLGLAGGALPLLGPATGAPDPFSLLAFVGGLTLPPLVAGAYRLLAPRRWLVR